MDKTNGKESKYYLKHCAVRNDYNKTIIVNLHQLTKDRFAGSSFIASKYLIASGLGLTIKSLSLPI